MKRLVLLVAVLALMVAPGAAAFHHGGLPSTQCADDSADSPSNNNGMAKEGLAHNPHFDLPLPPVGTPGNAQGDGGEHCANASD